MENEGWRDAIKKEFNDMIKRGDGEESNEVHSTGKQLVQNGCSRGREMEDFSARLCGLGYTQIAGMDFASNYVPVVNDITFRMLLILKMLMEWETELIDIETALLH